MPVRNQAEGALAGGAFLALWNDIARAREAEYDQWHTLEHLPERVAVRGMRGARRYVNRGRDVHRYFTLYEVDAPDVFDSPEYQDLLKQPTAWSAAMRPDFERFVRAPFRVERSRGAGIGAALGVLAYARNEAAPHVDAVGMALTLPAIVAVHEGAGGIDDAAAGWRSGAQRAPAPRSFDTILLIEALDRGAAAHALASARRMLDLRHLPADFGADVYDFVYAFPGHVPGLRRRYRRPHWSAADEPE